MSPVRRRPPRPASLAHCLLWAGLLCASLLFALAAPAGAATPVVESALDRTMAYLEAYAASGEAGDEMAPYLVEAAVAAGLDPAAWPEGAPALGMLQEHMEERAGRPLIHRLRGLHAMAAAGLLDAGQAEAEVLAAFNGGQLGDPSLTNDDVWGLLVVSKAGVPPSEPRVQATADFLGAHQTEDGGWSWMAQGAGESDMTGMAMAALAAVGRLDDDAARQGLAFLNDQTYLCSNLEPPSATCPPGGVALAKGTPGNCDSTVWAIRGHVAAGTDLPQRDWQFLRRLENADGSYDFVEGGKPAIICTVEMATLLGDAVRLGWDTRGYDAGVPTDGLSTSGAQGIPALPPAAALAGLVAAAVAARRGC